MATTMAKTDFVLFVSHVREDRAAAMEIVAEMERRGVPCWVAPRDVRPGKPFDDEIAEAIENCRAMLLIFSDRCNKTEYIRREVTVAGEAGKDIITFRIEDVEPRRALRLRLSDLNWIDGFVSRESAIDEITKMFLPAKGEARTEPAIIREANPPSGISAERAVDERSTAALAKREVRPAAGQPPPKSAEPPPSKTVDQLLPASLIGKVDVRKRWGRWPLIATAGAILILLVGYFLFPTLKPQLTSQAPQAVPPAHPTPPQAQQAPPPVQPTTLPPPQETNPPEHATAKYTVQANLDMYGQDISLPDGQIGILLPDINACTARCDSNKSCVAFSFDRWAGLCYLKNKIVAPLLDPRSVMAVKEGFEIPNLSKAPIEIAVVHNRRFGGNLLSKRVSNLQACRDACTDYVNCIAFSFLKTVGAAENCQFFRASERGHINDASADSGYKFQSPQAPPRPQ